MVGEKKLSEGGKTVFYFKKIGFLFWYVNPDRRIYNGSLCFICSKEGLIGKN